jgi:hypothetical protein
MKHTEGRKMTGVFLPAPLRGALDGIAVRDHVTLSATLRRLLARAVSQELITDHAVTK